MKTNNITVTEETSAMIMNIAKLDEVFNFVDANTADKIADNYKGMRMAFVNLLAQHISENICLDAHCI